MTGYYDPHSVKRHVFQVKAITRRRNPIFLSAFGGRPITENQVLVAFPKAPVLLRDLKALSPRVIDVFLPPETGFLSAFIKMKKTFGDTSQEEAKRFAFATFARIPQLKQVFIFDEDIDIYNRASVIWAMTTRVRPELDIHVIPRCPSSMLEVAYGKERQPVSGKLIIDATWKYQDFPARAEPAPEIMDKINLKDYLEE
ncbi:UbiD family decarboxylase domain-containing protein [Chloroflexota bacterium]